MRQPGQRVPIGGVGRGEGPFDTLRVQSVLDVLVFGYVLVVIVIEKLIVPYLLKSDKCSCPKQQANQEYIKFTAFFAHLLNDNNYIIKKNPGKTRQRRTSRGLNTMGNNISVEQFKYSSRGSL
jgi:hypothetical protein